ncbi:hypothetical protein [Streptomyces hiroshimensis]|uniref:Tat pathway signal sequence domain protein n=1 Tax=Streptomyces hiroshimensis TaxID=66424 RepID=A0ABQ2YN59_9ACTN|nr:hypothetical protein [Streptomyces hiroshimensis]GGX87245.1 hypothetical protein GCM10010324_35920 [Streptomyces hiroshimensis]
MNPSRLRRTRTAAVAAALGVAALVPTAPPAQANAHGGGAGHDKGAVLLECAGTVAATYSPGLTLLPRAVSITSQALVGCPLSTDPAFTSAAFGGSSSGTLSCLLGPAAGTLTFHWGEGREGAGSKNSALHGKGGNDRGTDRTSTATIRSVAAVRPNGNVVTVSTGKITEGAFKGATVVTEVTLLASQQTACTTSQGLTSASGPTTVTILRL